MNKLVTLTDPHLIEHERGTLIVTRNNKLFEKKINVIHTRTPNKLLCNYDGKKCVYGTHLNQDICQNSLPTLN